MVTATKTKRTQVQRLPVLSSVDELSDVLRELCDIGSTVSAAEARLQEEITKLREKTDDELKETLERRARLEHDAEEFVAYHRDTIFPTGRKTLVLAHGEVGYRTHPPAVIVSKKKRMTIPAVIDLIKSVFGKKADSYLRVKEELNKEVLVTLDEADLEKVGLEIQRKETFGITLNLESLQPAGTQSGRMATAAS